MTLTTETLYDLLPAIHRIRDAERGEVLRTLLDVIAAQGQIVEADIDRLYDNLFIETAQEWVVPYIGDLLGVGHLYTFEETAAFSQRARVANTLAYRRRKGTAPMLEQLAFDSTGWRARVVEFFERLGTTQYLNHLRPHNLRTPDLRDAAACELIGTAFDTATYTADVRPISDGAARPNISNIGVYLWRLAAYAMPRGQAGPVAAPSDGRYTFNPLGLDAPLFNRPQTEEEITHLAEEINVPAPLRRRALYDELEARRQALAEGRAPTFRYFDDRDEARHPPVFQLFFDEIRNIAGRFVPVPLDEVMVCDLSAWDDAGWSPPGASKLYAVPQPDGTTVDVSMPIRAAVDPLLGRLALPVAETPDIVHVSHAYGFSGDVGGGPYNRRTSLDAAVLEHAPWLKAVGRPATLAELGTAADGTTFFETITDAVAAWNAQTVSASGTIAVLDNASYEEDLVGPTAIRLAEGQRLTILSADWPGWMADWRLVPNERRAHLRGRIEIDGTADIASDAPGELTINGMLVEGRIDVLPGHLGRLAVAHSTLVEGIRVDGSDPFRAHTDLIVALERCVSGPLVVPVTAREVRIVDSLVHARVLTAPAGLPGTSLAADIASDAAGPPAVIERSTLLGRVFVQSITLAADSIFASSVVAERLQQGCVRFCYVPPTADGRASRTSRRYRCQPDLALEARAAELGVRPGMLSAAEVRRVQTRLVPGFTSTHYARPGFGQLGAACPEEIRKGAEDGSELGVFSFLKSPQRIANLRASLDEYLRLGLEAGLILVT